MKTVFLINETDNFHSLNSFRLVGIASTKNNAIILINEALIESEHGERLSEEMKFQIEKLDQTQQDEFDWEYHVKEVKLNQLY